MANQFILNAWKLFEGAHVQKGSSDEHIRDAKRAFYGGAMAVMSVLIKHLELDKPDEMTENDEQIMTDMYRELEDYTELVKRGLA
jgi:hypothetical protein